MATNNMIMGHLAPAAATPTTLYTVPAGRQANVNIFVTNTHASATDYFRLALVPNGDSIGTDNYIAYQMPVDSGKSLNYTGIALAAEDLISIYTTNGTCSFVATGLEIS